MTLVYDWAKSCAFLKSPCHEDSEKGYHIYGGQKFARLAVRAGRCAWSLLVSSKFRKKVSNINIKLIKGILLEIPHFDIAGILVNFF